MEAPDNAVNVIQLVFNTNRNKFNDCEMEACKR